MYRTALVLLFIIIPALSFAGDKPSVSDFEIVSFECRWESGSLIFVGELKNISDQPRAPQVQIIARDAGGTLVDVQRFWPHSISNVPPRQSLGVKHKITEDSRANSCEISIIKVTAWD